MIYQCFFLITLLSCNYIVNVTNVPKYVDIELAPSESLCFDSNSVNTIYGLVQIPDEFVLEEYEQSSSSDELPITYTSKAKDSKLILNSKHIQSRLSIISDSNGGKVTSVVCYVKDLCPHGIFTTNNNNFVIDTEKKENNMPSDLGPLQRRCFMFGAGATELNVSINYTFQNGDKLSYIKGDEKNIDIELTNNLSFLSFPTNNKQPMILAVQTSKSEKYRSLKIQIQSKGDQPVRKAFDELIIRAPNLSGGNKPSKWIIYGVPIGIGCIIIIIVLIIVLFLLKKRRSIKVEASGELGSTSI